MQSAISETENNSIVSWTLPIICYELLLRLDWETALAKPTKDIFISNLRFLIDRLGNAKLLAERIGVSPSTIGRWKDGTTQPSYEDLDALAKVAGAPVSWFFGDHAEARKSPRELSPEEQLQRDLRLLEYMGRKVSQLTAAVQKALAEQDELRARVRKRAANGKT